LRFKVRITKIRPSEHEIVAYAAEYGCKNAGNHLQDILKFLEQLETKCPVCMEKPTQLHLDKY